MHIRTVRRESFSWLAQHSFPCLRLFLFVKKLWKNLIVDYIILHTSILKIWRYPIFLFVSLNFIILKVFAASNPLNKIQKRMSWHCFYFIIKPQYSYHYCKAGGRSRLCHSFFYSFWITEYYMRFQKCKMKFPRFRQSGQIHSWGGRLRDTTLVC